MFCPKCGKAEQSPETYCRQCGVFLPDLSKPLKSERPPEEHIKVNSVLSLMTVIVSFTLAILLWSMMAFRPDTHPLVYVTASLLFAMGAWHIQTFIRIRKLKKQLKITKLNVEDVQAQEFGALSTAKLLDRADFSNAVPQSVTEHTTTHLDAKIPR